MKVLHVIDSAGLYGAEMVVLSLMEEQLRGGMEPVLGSIGEKRIAEKAIEREAQHRGLSCVSFRMRNGPNLLGALRLLQFAKKVKVDLIHSHGYKADILMASIPRGRRGLPVVATLHGWTSTRPFSKLWLYEWLDRKSLMLLDAVVVVNETMLGRLTRRVRQRAKVVPNGIAPLPKGLEEREPANEIASFCGSGFVVGTIGRLSTEKGYGALVEAVHLLRTLGVMAKLVILGEGPERKRLEALIEELGMKREILLPGYLENARRYLPKFNVLVLSSVTEGLPIVLLEAMEAGIPVVATQVGGIPEALEHGNAGVLVSRSDREPLAEGIRFVHDNPQSAANLAKRAQTVVREKYSMERTASLYQQVYEQLLRGV
jgi:glycosyltransferase involved in cell wall biosynthesis